MLREPLVDEGVIGGHQIENVSILANDVLEQQFRFALECLPQIVVEIGIDQPVRVPVLQFAKEQPLARKVPDKRLRLRILQHPLDLALEHDGIFQFTVFGNRQKLFIRDAAPQKE